MNRLLIILLVSLLTSCASIFNSGRKYVTIHTPPGVPTRVIQKNDTITVSQQQNSVTLPVRQASQTFRFKYSLNDRPFVDTLVRSQLTPLFWLNVLNFYGFIIDGINNSAMHSFRPVYLYKPEVSKQFLVEPNLSMFYSGSIVPKGYKRINLIGAFGLGLKFHYYTSEKEFLTLSTDLNYPLHFNTYWSYNPGAIVYSGNTLRFGLSYNYRWKEYSLGCGLGYTNTYFKKTEYYTNPYIPTTPYEDPCSITETSYNHSLGLSIPIRYHTGNNVNLECLYQPTFFRFGHTKRWIYEHSITFGITYSIPIKQVNKKFF